MSCLYSAQGEYICIEKFANCTNERIEPNGMNCGDTCQFKVDGFQGKCYARHPEEDKETCECDQKYKYVQYYKDENSYSEIKGINAQHGVRVIGGVRAKKILDTSPNECFYIYRQLNADAYTTTKLSQDLDMNNQNKYETCKIFFNGN